MLCPNFDFSYFPFDHQNCTIALRGPRSNTGQKITLIKDKVDTKEGFEYCNLNLQYAIEPTEFDTSRAKDPTSYVGVTLKFTRYFPPFFK